MADNPYNDDLRLAHVIADQVDSLTMDRFGALDLVIETKPDTTPVSDADKAAEDLIRALLSHARPRDAILGEERGETGHSNRKWIIDPIDGTKNFIRGVPVWATLIALIEDGDPKVGLVSAPALKRRWWAAQGQGAFTGTSLHRPKRIHVSDVEYVVDASLSYSSLDGWLQKGRGAEFLELQSKFWRTRAFGDFWSYMLVAEGGVDAACEPDLYVYDMAALVTIVVEAGGKFTSLTGDFGPYGGNALATNGRIHDDILRALNWPTPLPEHTSASHADSRDDEESDDSE